MLLQKACTGISNVPSSLLMLSFLLEVQPKVIYSTAFYTDWNKLQLSGFNCLTQHVFFSGFNAQRNSVFQEGGTANKSSTSHTQITDGRGQPLNYHVTYLCREINCLNANLVTNEKGVLWAAGNTNCSHLLENKPKAAAKLHCIYDVKNTFVLFFKKNICQVKEK